MSKEEKKIKLNDVIINLPNKDGEIQIILLNNAVDFSDIEDEYFAIPFSGKFGLVFHLVPVSTKNKVEKTK